MPRQSMCFPDAAFDRILQPYASTTRNLNLNLFMPSDGILLPQKRQNLYLAQNSSSYSIAGTSPRKWRFIIHGFFKRAIEFSKRLTIGTVKFSITNLDNVFQIYKLNHHQSSDQEAAKSFELNRLLRTISEPPNVDRKCILVALPPDNESIITSPSDKWFRSTHSPINLHDISSHPSCA